MHHRMLQIRGTTQRAAVPYRDAEVSGFVHLPTGQVASAVGACWPLRPTKVTTSVHLGNGHLLATGLAPLPMFAEPIGRAAGTSRVQDCSMHIADPAIGSSDQARNPL
jgi:2-oxoisovalerate dehydrogenase E1 component